MSDTAWLYLVVSTSRQAETLIDQEAWATTAAAAEGWAITRTFQGSASGKTAHVDLSKICSLNCEWCRQRRGRHVF